MVEHEKRDPSEQLEAQEVADLHKFGYGAGGSAGTRYDSSDRAEGVGNVGYHSASVAADLNPATNPDPQAATTVQHPPVQEGLEVVSTDGSGIGKVKQVRVSDFLVDRPLHRDVYVPFESVQSIRDGKVLLNIAADKVDDMGWANPDPLSNPAPSVGGYQEDMQTTNKTLDSDTPV